MTGSINPALIGKAGEMLVAAELMRRGVEVAYPASDVGVDLLAYRLEHGQAVAGRFVPVQVKARSGAGCAFFKDWFARAPGVVLVHVWHVATTPEFYIFRDLADVEAALDAHAASASWRLKGGYSITNPTPRHLGLMKAHSGRWERITDYLEAPILGANFIPVSDSILNTNGRVPFVFTNLGFQPLQKAAHQGCGAAIGAGRRAARSGGAGEQGGAELNAIRTHLPFSRLTKPLDRTAKAGQDGRPFITFGTAWMISSAKLAFVLVIACPALASAAPCIKDGATVTLSGKLHHRSVAPDRVDGLPGHKYDQLILDQPLCMQEGDFGDAVPAAKTVAIMPERQARTPEGSHVTLVGRAMHQQTLNEPPDAVQLDTSP